MRRTHEYGMWWMCSVFLFTSSYSMSRRALPNMTSSTRCTPRYYQFSIRMFASSAEVSQTIAFRCKDIVFLCFHCSQQCSESSAPLLLQAQDQHMNRVTVTQCSWNEFERFFLPLRSSLAFCSFPICEIMHILLGHFDAALLGADLRWLNVREEVSSPPEHFRREFVPAISVVKRIQGSMCVVCPGCPRCSHGNVHCGESRRVLL